MAVAIKIMEAIKSKPRITPTMLCQRLKLSYATVNNCLWHLKDLKLVKNANHGVYEITDWGKYSLKIVEGMVDKIS